MATTDNYALHAVGGITAWEAGLLETEQLLVLRGCGKESPTTVQQLYLHPRTSA